MVKKSFIIFFGLFAFLYVYSQKAVFQLPVTPQSSVSNPTFFYILPKTAFKVDVVITKTTNIKGIYAEFAEKMLGITNYCKESSISYELKKLSVTSFTVPDENLQFVVELSPVQVKNNFLQTLHTQNSVTGFRVSSSFEENNADILPEFFKNFADVITHQTQETYTETRIIDGVVTQVPITQTRTVTKSLSQQAQAAVDFIEKVRKDRYAIISFEQETTLSKEAFEYLVNQLNDLEKQYLELFTGITLLEDIHESVIVYPGSDFALTPLCAVSPTNGFSAIPDKTNANNYYLKCTLQGSTSSFANYIDSSTDSYRKSNTGYRIRKAAPALVSLMHGNVEKAVLGVYPVYQFGLLETLPEKMDGFEIWRFGYIQ
jgi:hypothetical protein